MKKDFKAFTILTILSLNGYAQQSTTPVNKNWKMQPIHMKTRWAREVSPANALIEYPRPQMTRKNWQNLNGLWEYAIAPRSNERPAGFNGRILVPYPLESALSGVQKTLMPNQHLWYKRSIQKPGLNAGERLLLHFGAVDWQTTVFVNNKAVGSHAGGYQHFSFDITDYLREGSNELLVRVSDPTDQGPNPHGKQVLNPGNIYYTPSSGIWQTVWMERVPAAHIEGLEMTPDIDKEILTISVGASYEGQSLAVELKAKEGGRVVSTIRGKVGKAIQLPVKNAHLWSPDDPFLYDLSVKLIQGDEVIDSVMSYFGMRKIAIQKDEKGVDRIFLNNQYTYNLGILDQGFWPDGLMTAPTDEALAFDIKAIKTMGFNTIRKHIKVEPARWYYHADKTGVLVWQDFVNPPHHLPEEAKAIFEKETKETMDQLYNHPSIVTWVLFNERWGAYDQKRLTEWVKTCDPSRLVNGHSGELLYVNEELRAPSEIPWISSDMTDIHSYPDPMSVPAQPGKAQVLGEFGGIGVSVPEHQWNDLQGWGYIQVSPSALKKKYAALVKQLKELEAEGLSGSIYTQPFDVEGEENGLLTYDREVIKIPVRDLRAIHQPLVVQTAGFALDSAFVIAKNVETNDTDNKYAEFLEGYEKGKRDSAFLRRLTLMAMRKKDQARATQVGNDYISGLKQVYSMGNLTFISEITRTSKDKGFELFRRQHEKVNAVLGDYAAERKVMAIINKEEIPADTSWKNTKPDWDAIESTVVRKYGALGEEIVWGERMIYYMEAADWDAFGKYYALYFERAGLHSSYHINNISWRVFEHVTDPEVLQIAIKWMKYETENLNKTPQALDTYANLLHKVGKTAEAIKWQEKAVAMAPDNRSLQEKLVKMRKGEQTWQ